MSAELVPINNDIAEATDRRAALERLNAAAENAATPNEARAVMLQAAAASDLLQAVRAPFDDARQAGKASVLAARRLGRLLAEVPGTATAKGKGHGPGRATSERGVLVNSLGMSKGTAGFIIRLGRVYDADFQRYIQDETKIPTVNGALAACSVDYQLVRQRNRGNASNFHKVRRKRAGVKRPTNPSLDEGYSCLVVALGHISECIRGGSQTKITAIGAALQLMYEAEDLLKPYRAGYGE